MATNDNPPWVPPEVRERAARAALDTAARALVEAQRAAEAAEWSHNLVADLRQAWETLEQWRRDL
jgi:hypothetical protein